MKEYLSIHLFFHPSIHSSTFHITYPVQGHGETTQEAEGHENVHRIGHLQLLTMVN